MEIGDEIRGKYRLLRVIGEGGMGVVYEALHLALKQRVAIKLLHPSRDAERDTLRFLREGRAAAQLRSHHVARVLDVDAVPEVGPFLVMELLVGRDLDSELQRRGRLGLSEAVDYLLQACDALAEAHERGIVHRDLKPSNLFLCDVGDERILKVLDFGVSKLSDEPNVTLTHTALGTPLYMSPEQIRNSKEVDHRSDLWALGVILFELLTGRPPFEGAPTAVSVAIAVDPPPWLSTLRTDVPPELERIVMRALEKQPDQRFASVGELAAALHPFASDPQRPGRLLLSALPHTLRPESSGSRPGTPSTITGSSRREVGEITANAGRRPRLAVYALAAGGVVFLGAVVALALGTASRVPPSTPASAQPSVAAAAAAATTADPAGAATPAAPTVAPRVAAVGAPQAPKRRSGGRPAASVSPPRATAPIAADDVDAEDAAESAAVASGRPKYPIRL